MNFNLEQSSEILNTPTGLAIVGPLLSSTSLYTRLNNMCIPHESRCIKQALVGCF